MTISFNRTLYVGNRELNVSVEATFTMLHDPYYGADADGGRAEPMYDAAIEDFKVVDQAGRDLTKRIRASEDLILQMDRILDDAREEVISAYSGERF